VTDQTPAEQAPATPAEQAPATPAEQAPATPAEQAPATPAEQMPTSPEWRSTTRRGAYAAMTLALLLGYTWISATRKVGWPLLPAAVLLLAGGYVLITTYVDRLPAVLGRDRLPIDSRTKYTLWLDQLVATWSITPYDPAKLALRMAILMTNGGNEVLQIKIERLELEVNGVNPVSYHGAITGYRILPGRSKQSWPPWVLGVPEGTVLGTIRYSIIYGPPSGFPSYRRTHAISFVVNKQMTCDMVRNSHLDGVVTQWEDLEPEEDQDLY
jgi:hypothetical protein